MEAILDDILIEDNIRTLVGIVHAEARPTNEKQQQQLAVTDQQIKDLDQQEEMLLDACMNPNFHARTVDAKGREIRSRTRLRSQPSGPVRWHCNAEFVAQHRMAAPPGLEPGLTAPKADVLPLHHGASVLIITLEFPTFRLGYTAS